MDTVNTKNINAVVMVKCFYIVCLSHFSLSFWHFPPPFSSCNSLYKLPLPAFYFKFFFVVSLLYFEIVPTVTPPSWSGSDSQSSTPANSSSAPRSVLYTVYIHHPSHTFVYIFFLLTFYAALFFFKRSLLPFRQPPLTHTKALSIFPFPAHFPPSLVCCHKVQLHPVFVFFSLCLSLFLPLSFCTWLCPIAVLAKRRADETVLNSVICQHIQPRELHCRAGFRVCVREWCLFVTMCMLPLCWGV